MAGNQKAKKDRLPDGFGQDGIVRVYKSATLPHVPEGHAANHACNPWSFT